MKLSELIRAAAESKKHFVSYSCCAVYGVIFSRFNHERAGRIYDQFMQLVDNMAGGHLPGFSAFDEFPWGEERQSVRYAWLHLVAAYADELGLEVTP